MKSKQSNQNKNTNKVSGNYYKHTENKLKTFIQENRIYVSKIRKILWHLSHKPLPLLLSA